MFCSNQDWLNDFTNLEFIHILNWTNTLKLRGTRIITYLNQ